MDCSIIGFSDGNPSAMVSKVTDNDWSVQRDDVNPALPRESSRGNDAAAVGLLQRSVSAGSSMQGVACADTINSNPSRCLLRLTERAGKTKKLQLIETINLRASIDELGVSDPQISPELKQQLINFAGYILQLELPLYKAEIHSLLLHVNNIVRECSESDQSDVWSIKSSLSKIEHLYPAFLESRHPGVFQLADFLLAYGFIHPMENSLIGNYGVDKFVSAMADEYADIPFSRFSQLITPLIDNQKFKQLLFDNPVMFLRGKNEEYVQFWEILVHKYFPGSLIQLVDKVFAKVFEWSCLPDAFILRYPDHFEQSLITELDSYCKGSVAFFESGIKHRCEVLRRIDKLLNRSSLAVPLSNFLVGYFSSLTEQQQQFFSVLLFVNAPQRFEQLLDTPSGKLLMESIIGWRSGVNATVFHCTGFDDGGSFRVISAALLEHVVHHYPEVLRARDNMGRTALESFIYFTGNFTPIVDGSAIQRLVEATTDGAIDPWHVVALLNQVDSSWGFHALLALHILGKPSLIRGGLEAVDNALLANDVARNFLRVALSGEKLLHELRSLPFSSTARITIAEQFPVHLRPQLFANPFSLGNWHVWTSKVLPFGRRKMPLSCPDMAGLPWSDFLHEAKVCFTAPSKPELLHQWQQHQSTPAVDQLLPFVQPLPPGQSGVYGRSCFFHDPDNATTLRLKLRKKMADGAAESWAEMASEPGKLSCLRVWQALGVLALQTRFPKPLGLFRIDNFQQWLAKSPLSPGDQQALWDSVAIEDDGSVLAYAYQTGIQEHYHRYPYETEGEGLSVELSLESLQIAANDLGLLLGCGLAATVLPMYHADERQFVLLAQLIDQPCPGVLGSWNDKATNYPNVSPGVGVRDYADIMPLTEIPVALDGMTEETPENRHIMHMEQIAREYFSLILLLPRVLEREMDFMNPDFILRFQRTIDRMSCTFFAGALKLAEEDIRRCLDNYGVTEELARVISYWCETGEHPRWVDHYRSGKLAPQAYAKLHRSELRVDNEFAGTVTDRGFYKTTHSKGLNLGEPNGVFPLLPLNKLLTMVFNLYIHKNTTSA